MNEMFTLMFSGFWTWLGFVVVFGMILTTVFEICKEFLKYLNIRKHGYPKYDEEID